ncbi:MAG: DUF3732 domain-containing protein [Chthoniobacteraceae bacterium]
MDIKIAKVILWPKNPANKIREVPFSPTGVTVLTGWSQKGKSALIHIVDYCLGSEKCAIPVGKVRDMVEWFGLLLHVPTGQILIARKNPGDQIQSSEMMIRTGKKLRIPDVPSECEGREAVIRQLNLIANLPPSDLNVTDSGFDGPPSFRDMAAFEFQPQHIIANPYTLFFKADTSDHREKLVRSVIPYVIGAVDAETLEAQARLRQTEGEWRNKREQLDQCRRAANLWISKLRSFYSTARDNNLIPNAPEPQDDWFPENYTAFLGGIHERLLKNPIPDIPSGLTRRAVRELTSLKNEYRRLLIVRDDKRRKLEKLGKIQSSSEGFSDALQLQAERLRPVGWVAERIRGIHECPLCGQESERGADEVNKLADAAAQIASMITATQTRDGLFESESLHLEQEISEAESQIQQLEFRIQSAEEQNSRMRELRDRRDFIHQFAGEVKSALEGIQAGSDVSGLAQEEKRLAEEVGRLQKIVNVSETRRKTQAALSSISEIIGHYARILKVEHATRRWELDPRSLTLKSVGEGQRTDYLWEIGSAANWMGFHVAALLAMHEHFRTVLNNPVPKFLILDQPSQAFFPEGIAAARSARRKNLSDDLDRLKRVFMALSDAIKRTERGLQIIVIEHADATVWKGIEHVKQMAEWRDKDALIPLDWK